MKKYWYIYSTAFLFLSFSLSAQDISGVDLREKRTEFTRTGTNIDSFFDALQARILYSFSQANHHFSLIFETAKKESKKKAGQQMQILGDKAVKQIQREAEKVIREKVDEEIKNMKEKVERKSSSALPAVPSHTAQKEKTLPEEKRKKKTPEKKEDFSIPAFPELDK